MSSGQYQDSSHDGDPYGRWPRRLLHARTMTSYPWEAGNTYNGEAEPRYNIISYTWGRFTWDKRDAEYAGALHLPVAGIHWQDFMPRMKPEHFSVGDLIDIIRIASGAYDGGSHGPGSTGVDWIWLDVACIDQTTNQDGSKVDEYKKEVGRQAKIFRGANQAFVWLHGTLTNNLQLWWSDLDSLISEMYAAQFGGRIRSASDGPPFEEWDNRIRRGLEQLTKDKWFTSLWTLQEAFLRPDASILCKDARHTAQRWRRESRDFLRLVDISYSWNIVRNVLHVMSSQAGDRAEYLMAHISNKIGILDAVRGHIPTAYTSHVPGNPLSLLVASHHREVKPEWQNDRVYGIMQVYDLRLGESAPTHREGKKYDLEALTDQLGAALISKYPIVSQVVVQGCCRHCREGDQRRCECPADKAWRVNSGLTLPPEALTLWRHLEATVATGSHSSFVALAAEPHPCTGMLMARFHGRTTALDEFCSKMRKIDAGITGEEESQLLNFSSTTMLLDGKWQARMERSLGREALRKFPARLGWLMEGRSGHRLKLLLLNRLEGPSIGDATNEWGVALILLRKESDSDGEQSYERLGLWVWKFWWINRLVEELSLSIPSDVREYLDGKGEAWRLESGYYG